MYAVGVDLTDHGARAVLVDTNGVVADSASVSAAADPADLAAASVGAARALATGHAVHVFGVAADVADRPRAETVARDLRAGGSAAICGGGAASVAAEAWTGAAAGARHAVCLWVGDRVLAGILLNGEPWTGAHGLAGYAAWMALNPVERQDYRKLGNLAAEISHSGIARRLAWRIQAGDHSAVLDRAGDLESITAAHVFEGARSGDGVAISVVRDTARYIGMAIANLASTIDPEVAVIAGPVTAAGDLLLEAVRHECGRRLPPRMTDQFRCELSALGIDGIAIGAARLALMART